ncbi:DUF4394 domain-containing protein [Jiangella alkaliphila]|uniref:DUF4394 domain-containing protein n=1 Tax=Jiangella alkaliphila TaxID=419479 RepID=A0A1H2L8C4_9ACTN|nr:DUF4394 domain-containing protein [Jiangella alkaliphila]SDU76841.1 protein of unknown function [Jiangella alkaliphila]
MRRIGMVVAAVLAAGVLAAPTASAAPASASTHNDRSDLLVLGSNGVLSRHNGNVPLLVEHRVRITGLAHKDRLVGMDVRPANGAVYVIGASGQLYTVDARSGKATKVGAPAALAGTAVGLDFNPTVDRIRLVTDTGQNLRLHPDTGAVAAVDGMLAYATGGGKPEVAASGYTNSVAGATSTALYGVDSRTDTLVLQGSVPGATPVVSPNTGQLFPVGRLGLNVVAANGFDIDGAAPIGEYKPNDYRAVAAVRTGLLLGLSLLVDVDLRTGRAKVLAPLLTSPVGVAFTG